MKDMERSFSDLSHCVIGCAFQVHRALGPGLLESTYRDCLSKELATAGILHRKERPLPAQ